MKRIMLLMDGASEFDRKLLRGLVRYSKDGGDFIFYRMSPSMTGDKGESGDKAVIAWARKWKADAIIGRWGGSDTSALEKLHIPVVLQNVHERSKKFSNLTGDYIGTGEMAADFFFRRRNINFAYFGIKGTVWSEERLLGYRKRVAELGGSFHSLMMDIQNERDEKKIASWLCELPKPVALFACDDSHALTLSEICKMNGIRIPDDVALLGVDDDELVCEISDPPISSIALDVEQGGFDAGKALHAMISGEQKGPFNIVIAPGMITQRASTQHHNISDPYIDKLVKYIEGNFNRDISTANILEQIPLSRRSLELKFKREMGGLTIYKYLTQCRIEHFAQLLVTSDLSLGEIASRSGISDYSNFSRIFKKHMGVSPQDYKKLKKPAKAICI